jgi:hypothetical protein
MTFLTNTYPESFGTYQVVPNKQRFSLDESLNWRFQYFKVAFVSAELRHNFFFIFLASVLWIDLCMSVNWSEYLN